MTIRIPGKTGDDLLARTAVADSPETQDFLDAMLRGYTGDTYPGSKMKRETRKPDPEPDDEIIWPKGRPLTIQGREVECFTTGQLAYLLGGRKAVTIRGWEAEGILPKSGYFIPGKGGDPRGRRRYYTRAQCEAVIDIARAEGVLYPSTRTSVKRTGFTKKVLDTFIYMREHSIR
jgi:hypothetical protein